MNRVGVNKEGTTPLASAALARARGLDKQKSQRLAFPRDIRESLDVFSRLGGGTRSGQTGRWDKGRKERCQHPLHPPDYYDGLPLR